VSESEKDKTAILPQRKQQYDKVEDEVGKLDYMIVFIGKKI
jgi:hypothetical protein